MEQSNTVPQLVVSDSPVRSLRTNLVALWGVVGVSALLLQAVVRLGGRALEPWRAGTLETVHLVVMALWIAFSAYAEGYRGFQKRFCPKVVGRAVHAGEKGRPLHMILAAPYSMCLFHADRRGLTTAWGLIVGIIGLVLLVRLVPQPWRGVIDAGVVVGLVYGLVAMWILLARVLLGHEAPPPQSIPPPAGQESR